MSDCAESLRFILAAVVNIWRDGNSLAVGYMRWAESGYMR
jgi:hypothetical protein